MSCHSQHILSHIVIESEENFIKIWKKNIEFWHFLSEAFILNTIYILAAYKKNYSKELKKILGFYNNEKSHDFDEDTLKTQLQIFSKNFPPEEHLFFYDIHNCFK